MWILLPSVYCGQLLEHDICLVVLFICHCYCLYYCIFERNKWRWRWRLESKSGFEYYKSVIHSFTAKMMNRWWWWWWWMCQLCPNAARLCVDRTKRASSRKTTNRRASVRRSRCATVWKISRSVLATARRTATDACSGSTSAPPTGRCPYYAEVPAVADFVTERVSHCTDAVQPANVDRLIGIRPRSTDNHLRGTAVETQLW